MSNLDLNEKLELLTSQDIYNILVGMNFPVTVAQFFKEKTSDGVKKFLFDDLKKNPIQNVYLNVILMKLLNEIRGKDSNKIKFPFNNRDPLLINEESTKSLLACFPSVKTKRIHTDNDDDDDKCINLEDEKENAKKVKLNQVWSNFFEKNAQKISVSSANKKPVLKSVENNMIIKHSIKSDARKEPSMVVNEKCEEEENDFDISRLISKIQVNNKFQIISLLDPSFMLPEFSSHIEDALNDENACLEILNEMSEELACFLISNGFHSLSQIEYKAITNKLLYKYDILYGMLNRKVEQDFKQKVTHLKEKPESIIQKHIALELIKYHTSEKHKFIQNKVDSNNKTFELRDKIQTNNIKKDENETKRKVDISKWLNDSSEALCDL